jgi:hypothetical protein
MKLLLFLLAVMASDPVHEASKVTTEESYFTPGPEEAWLLFPDYQPSAPEVREFEALLKELDAEDWKARERASARIASYYFLLANYDRQNMTPEQRQRLDAVTKQTPPVSAGLIKALRNDRKYVEECLVLADDRLRPLLKARLKELDRQVPTTNASPRN